MLNEKPWYASKTVWGSTIAILAALASLWDFDLSPAEQERLAEQIVQLIGAAGGVIALVGRFLATSRLS